MDTYEERVKILQAKAKADLQAELQKSPIDPLRADRIRFLTLLVDARRKQRLSQADLAKRLGMQQSAIARIENSRGNPSLRTLLAIAKALEVSLVVE